MEDKLLALQEEGSIHFDRKDKDSVSAKEKTLKAEVSRKGRACTNPEVGAIKLRGTVQNTQARGRNHNSW